jgi:hypothetical protein
LIGFIANYGWHKDAAPMRFLPIVERELRLFVRRPRCYYARSLTAVIATCIAAGTIIVQLSGGALPSEIGANLFSTLSLLAFGFALLAGPFITADSLSSENREGTLGLLFLTHLRSHDIVIGKLVSTGLPALFWPLAIIPVMSFSFPLGGLPQPVFWRMCLVLVVTLFFSLGVGLFISSLCKTGYRAITGTLVLIAAITAGLPALGNLTSAANPLLVFSPAFAYWTSFEANYIAEPWGFASSIASVLVQTVLLIFIAVAVLPQAWRDGPKKSRSASLLKAIGDFGIAPPRGKEREDMLTQNPILWLANRNRRNRAFLWFAFALIAIGILSAIQMLPRSLPRGPLLFFTLFGFHTIIKFWVARTACHRFAEDRHNGALELLLTSPITERSIIQGWLTGLKQRFMGPVVALVAVDLVLFVTGMTSMGGAIQLDVAFLATIGLFIADSYTLCWVGFWFGLSSATPTKAFYRTIGFVLVLPWVVFLGIIGGGGIFISAGGFLPSIGTLTVVWFGIGYLTDLFFCAWAISKLDAGFREAALHNQNANSDWKDWISLRQPALQAESSTRN